MALRPACMHTPPHTHTHTQSVVNRDIKLENTLLDSSPRPLVKICDFGYSKVCSGSQPSALWVLVPSGLPGSSNSRVMLRACRRQRVSHCLSTARHCLHACSVG